MSGSGIVIIGAGMAGAQLALALRRSGCEVPVTLLGAEPDAPYQRPPLSKAFLDGDSDKAAFQRPESFFAERDIRLKLNGRVAAIERAAHELRMSDGEVVGYEHLVLATGSRNRQLRTAGTALQLRTLADARLLRQRLSSDGRIVIVGGGFIGLELAAAASARGMHVTVIEASDRLLARMASRQLSQLLAEEHIRHGVKLVLGAQVVEFGEGHVVTDADARFEAELVVVSVGVVPNDDLAVDAGLETADGVVVDAHLRTQDPHISALGDCVRFPCAVTGRMLRLESVQNANEQARYLAGRLLGATAPYAAVPWFWTEQYARQVQIAGVAEPEADSVVRRDDQGRLVIERFKGDCLTAVESVDDPGAHATARKALFSNLADRPL